MLPTTNRPTTPIYSISFLVLVPIQGHDLQDNFNMKSGTITVNNVKGRCAHCPLVRGGATRGEGGVEEGGMGSGGT